MLRLILPLLLVGATTAFAAIDPDPPASGHSGHQADASAMVEAKLGTEPTATETEPAAEPDPVGETESEAVPADADVAAGNPLLQELLDVKFMIENLWILFAAFLVFIMHLGFATLESGLCRSKNTVNILFKNTLIPTIGLVLYALWGFNLMYPGTFNGFLGFAGFGLDAGADGGSRFYLSEDGTASYTYWSDFLFQGMFAATAMTIVSGCVAERIKLAPFLIFTVFYVGIVYPLVGSWVWGSGWLCNADLFGLEMKDFAGSTLVHSVGGWAGLAGILVLGARKGKYGPGGETTPILPSNLPMATVGVFLLWFGWFGFNGGSVLSADPASIAYVCVTTSLAAATGGIAAALTSWFHGKKPDLTMALNGILAGLVGVTASADVVTLTGAMIIGIVCGIVVYFAVLGFDKLRIDDPVGALSVHLVCGIIGTLCAGLPFLMGTNDAGETLAANLGTQMLGIAAYGVTCFAAALVFWILLKATVGIRVDEDEEDEGLDIGEHGEPAYTIISHLL